MAPDTYGYLWKPTDKKGGAFFSPALNTNKKNDGRESQDQEAGT
jgi:hypothetical protein